MMVLRAAFRAKIQERHIALLRHWPEGLVPKRFQNREILLVLVLLKSSKIYVNGRRAYYNYINTTYRIIRSSAPNIGK